MLKSGDKITTGGELMNKMSDFYVIKIGNKFLGSRLVGGAYEPVLREDIDEAEKFYRIERATEQLKYLKEDGKYKGRKRTLLKFKVELIEETEVSRYWL